MSEPQGLCCRSLVTLQRTATLCFCWVGSSSSSTSSSSSSTSTYSMHSALPTSSYICLRTHSLTHSLVYTPTLTSIASFTRGEALVSLELPCLNCFNFDCIRETREKSGRTKCWMGIETTLEFLDPFFFFFFFFFFNVSFVVVILGTFFHLFLFFYMI